MEILTARSLDASSEYDLAGIEAQTRRVITDSLALVNTFGRSSFSSVPWFNVPNPIFTFVGRFDQLRQLNQSLLHQSQIVAITHPLLVGMGGIGKSELAILFAHHSRPFFR